MAGNGRQQRKPDFRTVIEDVKAIAAVVFGRTLNLRNPAVVAAIGGVATLVLALVVVRVLAQTGGAKAVEDNAALIGALVALGGVFTAQMVSIALDARRNQEARELEAQRAHEDALQNYLENVGTLMIEKKLLKASPGDTLSTVVRVQTLAVLEGLDPERKRILILSLYDSGLINEHKPVITLRWANLSEVDLSEVNLNRTYLSKASLGMANLGRAKLSQADLHGSDLHGADLRGADLRGADLSGVDLSSANLEGAVGITTEELEKQAHSLEGATMPDGSKPYP